MNLPPDEPWQPIATYPREPLSEFHWGGCERVWLSYRQAHVGVGYFNADRKQWHIDGHGWMDEGWEPHFWKPFVSVGDLNTFHLRGFYPADYEGPIYAPPK